MVRVLQPHDIKIKAARNFGVFYWEVHFIKMHDRCHELTITEQLVRHHLTNATQSNNPMTNDDADIDFHWILGAGAQLYQTEKASAIRQACSRLCRARAPTAGLALALRPA